jgi:hypothetical protein
MTKFKPLLLPTLAGWHMAGAGGFRWAEIGDALESFGGPGLLWYADEVFGDFTLNVEWRVMRPEDNSGVFLRCPALGSDVRPAVENGYEVQIDERGLDPATGRLDCPLHKTGAIYGLAPATGNASLPIGSWNLFEITAKKAAIAVRLNDVEISHLDAGSREPCGHIALQAHHTGSMVQFRRLEIVPM